MNKFRGVIAGVSAAAFLVGLAWGAYSIVSTIMALTAIQQFLVGAAGIGFGSMGLVATFRWGD